MKSKANIALVIFLLIGVSFLVTEHRAHLYGLLPFLLLLVCALMHLFMHGSHGHGSHGRKTMVGECYRSGERERGVLLSMLLGTGFLICLGWAAAMADEGAEEVIPPEYAGKVMLAGIRDDPKAHVTGKEIYEGKVNPEVNCALCHGIGGKPTKLVKGTPDLSDPAVGKKRSDAQWFWRISEKKVGSMMPGHKDKLTEEQRWQVIAYLRTLAQSGR